MPVVMTLQKQNNNINFKEIKSVVKKEFNFLKNVFSFVSLPNTKDEDSDVEMENEKGQNNIEKEELPKRARTIAELEEKLEKLKSQKKFNLKNKLVKKSINSKLSKKNRKKERQKNKVKGPLVDKPPMTQATEEIVVEKKPKIERKPKPVFNTDGKLVFSKFDFSSVRNDKPHFKKEKEHKKILESLIQQDQKFRDLEAKEENTKVKELKEKMAWKTILQKAEGEKVKDDPLLLKKSIKKIEQKKKQSKKQWDKRIENVQQKKDDRQKKRRENISKKKKEKKSKIVKTAQKRGRVVI